MIKKVISVVIAICLMFISTIGSSIQPIYAPISRCDSKSGSVSQYSTNSSMPLLRNRCAQPALRSSAAARCSLPSGPKLQLSRISEYEQVFFRRGLPEGNASTHGIAHNVGAALGAFMPHTRNLLQERLHHTHHGVVAIKLNVAWLTASAMPQEIKRVCAVIA